MIWWTTGIVSFMMFNTASILILILKVHVSANSCLLRLLRGKGEVKLIKRFCSGTSSVLNFPALLGIEAYLLLVLFGTFVFFSEQFSSV